MPRFPFNFVDAALLTLIPPLWYYMINPFVDEVISNKPVDKSHKKITKLIK